MKKNQNFNSNIDIILPTYNGERYLRPQLKSILNQTNKNVRILIRDDGSSDQTVKIIKNFIRNYPDKICLIEDDLGNLKAANNILTILKKATAPYIMLADQDDVWKKNKIEILLKKIQTYEKNRQAIPILVASDSYVVDKDLKLIAPSFMEFQKLNNKRLSFANLLQKNVIQGASCIFNRALAKKAILGYPLDHIWHDHWLALVCAGHGNVYFCKQKLTYYRQHEDNQIGARLAKLPNNTNSYLNDQATKQLYYLYINKELCKKVKKVYEKSLDKKENKILLHFIENPNSLKTFFQLKLFSEYGFKDILYRIFIGIG